MVRARALLLLVLLHAAACGPADDAGGGAAGSSGEPGRPSAPPPARGPDGAAPVAEEASVRVVFLGTSLTAGLGLLRDSDRFTDRLQARADSAGLPVTIVNAGVSGETSAGGLRRLDWLLEDSLDVLVVELGANDGLRGQDPAALEANLREVVVRTRTRYPDATVVLVGMEAPPNMGAGYTRRFRDVFPRLAEELDAPLVPFLLEDVAGEPSLNQGDGVHPTAAGHRRMADNVWPVLEEVLRRELAAGSPADRSDARGGARAGGGRR